MKKYLYLVLTLIASIVIIPIVFAKEEVYIESIELIEQSKNAMELSKPKTNGLEIGFDLSFVDLQDYAKYKVIINNTTSKEYEIAEENSFKESSHLKYEFEFDKSINVVKANSKLTMYIIVTYNKKIDLTEYKNGIYKETNDMIISLSTNKVENPLTKDQIIITITIMFFSIVAFLIAYKLQNKKILNITIIFIMLIPMVVHAIEKLQVSITTKVTIEEKRNIIEPRYLASDHATPNGSYIPNERDFWQYQHNIKTITFETHIEEPDSYAFKFDVSEKKDNGIIAYLITNEENPTLYDLYIMCNGYIYANPDSSRVFYYFSKLTKINNFEYYKTPFATDMNNMFSFSSNMEVIDVSHFNTSNVTDMSHMFRQTTYHNTVLLKKIDVSGFDTSKVTDMNNMFRECNQITELDLSSFDTSNVIDMSHMFHGTFRLKSIDLSNFNTSKVTNMAYMFSSDNGLTSLDLRSFDTSNVTDMNHFVAYCSNLTNIDLSSFDTSNVTDMSSMFEGLTSMTHLDLSSFDTSKVTSMWGIFKNMSNLESINLSNFDTSNVESMRDMFRDCSKIKILDLSSFNTSNVTSMNFMFSGCTNLQNVNLSSFNTKKVTNMGYMFEKCKSLINLDISSFDTTNVEITTSMFNGNSNLEKIFVSNLWNIDNVVSYRSSDMFKECVKLPNFDPTKVDKTNANTSNTGYLSLKA